jgi:hypothetical protein
MASRGGASGRLLRIELPCGMLVVSSTSIPCVCGPGEVSSVSDGYALTPLRQSRLPKGDLDRSADDRSDRCSLFTHINSFSVVLALLRSNGDSVPSVLTAYPHQMNVRVANRRLPEYARRDFLWHMPPVCKRTSDWLGHDGREHTPRQNAAPAPLIVCSHWRAVDRADATTPVS